jgi:hypothetical protein
MRKRERRDAIVMAAPRREGSNRKSNPSAQTGIIFRINFLSPSLHNRNFFKNIPIGNSLLFSMGNTAYLIHWQTGFSGATIERIKLN